MEILNKNNISDQLGGKAHSLFEMERLGLNIPEWFVVPAQCFINWKNKNPLKKNEDFSFSEEEKSLIYSFLKEDGLYAVRSSARAEDSKTNSFAGQYETFLGIKKESVLEKIKSVFLSAYSDRLIEYAKNKDLEMSELIPSVIVQEQVQSDKSGVAFSVNPVNGNVKEILMSAVFGLGTGLVDGSINADAIIYNKNTKQYEENISLKEERDIIENGEFKTISLATDDKVLTQQEISKLVEMVLKIEKYKKCPQDIEWAIKDNVIYLLQSRPITTLEKIENKIDKITTWDNSNIVESYGGVVSPMTYSFIKFAYAEVYKQMCKMFNVPSKILNYNEYTFSHMLGCIKGHVYYNLVSWYKLLTMLPGYNFNKEFMIQMMGAKDPISDDVLERIEKEKCSTNKFEDYLYAGFGIVGLFTNYCRIKNLTQKFYENVKEAVDEEHLLKNIDTMSLEELSSYYRRLENKLIRKWDAPVINDFFAMIFYGVLRKISSNWGNGNLQEIYNDLLCGDGKIISTQPPKKIKEIAQYLVDSNRNSIEIFCDGELTDIEQELVKDGYLNKLIQEYIDLYGDRCLEELKLETLTTSDNPINLYRSIGSMGKKILSNTVISIDENKIRQQAEMSAYYHLKDNKIKEKLYFYIVEKTRYFVRNRENLRFERTRIFGVVRKIINQIGIRLFSLNLIEEPRDVFYLELNEILGFIEGNMFSTNLKELIKLRKAEEQLYLTADIDNRFDTQGCVNSNNLYKGNSQNNNFENSNVIKGTGCCPGTITGVVKIVKDPKNANLKEGEILITERTDPGWIMLFPIAGAVVVEKGSLLSHASIVLREMGIPSIVGIDHITSIVKDGDIITVNGSTGEIVFNKEVNYEK